MATPNMNLVLPTEGGSAGTWDTILDAVFGLIDSHGHVAGQGVPIVSAALNINADVPWGTNALTELKAAAFTAVASSAFAAVNALWTNTADNNLYFRNSSGTDVQVTDGSTLNVSIVGGIGGDYASVSALFSYDDASKRYLAQQEGSPRPWAGVATGGVDLYQRAASIANAISLISPSSLAASYSVTFPTALPGATAALQISSVGVMTASNTLVDVGHSTAWSLEIPPASAYEFGGSNHTHAPGAFVTGASTDSVFYPVVIGTGDAITKWTLNVRKQSDGSTTLTFKLWKYNGANSTVTQLGTTQTQTANNPGYTTVGQTLGTPETVAAGFSYYLEAIPTTGTANDYFMTLHIEYTRSV